MRIKMDNLEKVLLCSLLISWTIIIIFSYWVEIDPKYKRDSVKIDSKDSSV